MTTLAPDKLAAIEAIGAPQPLLSTADRAEYNKILARLDRAHADLARADKRGDLKGRSAANRAITRATAAREAFTHPRVGHLWAPERIIGKFESRWGTNGAHHQECVMILDHKALSGPSYRTIRVLRDEGGPPTNPRSAPTSMGVAWFALEDQIKRGKIVVLDEVSPS